MSGRLRPGDTFGPYQVVGHLASGGMGQVYEALEPALRRSVALKILLPHLHDDPDFRRRFAAEAHLLASLESPHVVSLFAYGSYDESLYLATQLVRGGDLAQRMKRSGPLAPAAALDVTAQVSSALADAHAKRLVHRDVKPSNVLVHEDRSGQLFAYLCDFGIARAENDERTTTEGVIGTSGFMAPERHQGHPASPASDIYSLGCVLWAMLHGSAPYADRTSALQQALAHMQDPVPTWHGAQADVVNRVLARSMAKDPAARYPSAVAMLHDLRSAVPSDPVAAPDPSLHDAATVHRTPRPVDPVWAQLRGPEQPVTTPPPAPPTHPASVAPPGRRPRRAALVAVGAVLAVAVGGGAAAAVALHHPDHSSSGPITPPSTSPTDPLTSPTTPTSPITHEPHHHPRRSGAVTTPPTTPATPTTPASVPATLASVPTATPSTYTVPPLTGDFQPGTGGQVTYPTGDASEPIDIVAVQAVNGLHRITISAFVPHLSERGVFEFDYSGPDYDGVQVNVLRVNGVTSWTMYHDEEDFAPQINCDGVQTAWDESAGEITISVPQSCDPGQVPKAWRIGVYSEMKSDPDATPDTGADHHALRLPRADEPNGY